MSKIALAADRVQTGVRIEKRLVKVLKAFAALQDLSLGDLLEHLVHRAFAGKPALEPPVLAQIHELMRIYGIDPPSLSAPTQEGK
ncbi:MAG TPA: hypothetical protein VKU44_01140 [Terriglobia bacterium]|nr:hypothetical protein [Terriglobia bacterium]